MSDIHLTGGQCVLHIVSRDVVAWSLSSLSRCHSDFVYPYVHGDVPEMETSTFPVWCGAEFELFLNNLTKALLIRHFQVDHSRCSLTLLSAGRDIHRLMIMSGIVPVYRFSDSMIDRLRNGILAHWTPIVESSAIVLNDALSFEGACSYPNFIVVKGDEMYIVDIRMQFKQSTSIRNLLPKSKPAFSIHSYEGTLTYRGSGETSFNPSSKSDESNTPPTPRVKAEHPSTRDRVSKRT